MFQNYRNSKILHGVFLIRKVMQKRHIGSNTGRGARFYDLAPFTVFDFFLTTFHHVTACLLFVNKKLPPIDQILRKVVPENVNTFL